MKSRALSKKCSILKWVSEDKEKETIKWIYACVIRRHLTSLWVVRHMEFVQYLKFRWVILNLSLHFSLFYSITTLTYYFYEQGMSNFFAIYLSMYVRYIMYYPSMYYVRFFVTYPNIGHPLWHFWLIMNKKLIK